MHSIDGKGRMIVPQSFREKMGKQIIVGVTTAYNAIAIYPFSVWQAKIDMLSDLAARNVKAEEYLERFAMYSFDNCSFDSQGRVLLPQALRDRFLKNAEGVQVSGGQGYVRVVSAEQAERENQQFEQIHPDPREEIGRIQVMMTTGQS